jgi:transcriptional regulator with XRE-family HTH domain
MDAHALQAALEDARITRGSGVPLAWSEIAEEVGIHQAAFSRLKQGRLPGPRSLRALMEWLEMDAEEFKVGGEVDLPIGGRDEEWDGEAATNRVFEWATNEAGDLDAAKLRSAFFWIDTSMDLNTRQAYKLPYCDVGDGGLHIVPRGMSAVSGGHGVDKITGASSGEKQAIKRKICTIYKKIVEKYDDWPDCPFNPDGTRPERRERRNDAEGEGEEFKDYSPEQRDQMAKDGEAMPDGSFPIADCADLKNAIQAVGRASDPAKVRAHIKKRAKALDCDTELPDDWSTNETEDTPMDEDEQKTAGIIGVGSLSKSEDPETMAMVARVQELLREGAVAVSIKHDLHPDVAAKLATLEGPFETEEEAAAAMLEANEIYSNAQIRPRHVAIVDTAAFSNARLTLGDDGYTVNGPVTFEGIYTGDVRTLKHGSLTWDDELLPIPIIWDRVDNDHDGAVVGYISSLERVDGMTTAVRPEALTGEEIEAVTAAAGSSALPAKYFAKFNPTKPVPLTVGEEDENGLRHIFGISAPKGVCHRSDMGACFQYPGDIDPQHRGFHTGQALTLDDGSTVRVGALTIGGKHIDPKLARQGVGFADIGRHRDDANTIFAMVRAWETPFGLAVSGVVMPSVDRDTLFRAAASSPSVELWPSGRGRTLVGIHLVPTPAWPVAASAGGDSQTLVGPEHVHVLSPEGGFCAECGEHETEVEGTLLEAEGYDFEARFGSLEQSLKRIEGALAVLALGAMTDIPMPEDSPEE